MSRTLGIRRRTFLGLLATVAGGTVWACGSDDASTPAPSPAPGTDGGIDGAPDQIAPLVQSYFDVWAEMREVVRTSPDHLTGQAARLVKLGDAAAIFAFVRDSIATVPSSERGLVNSATAVRWGTRATLRCGAGTMREKAELLAELYRAAGLSAEVVSGAVADELQFARSAVLRTVERTFDPQADDATMARWKAVFGLQGTSPAVPPVDLNGTASTALAANLLKVLPAPKVKTTFDWDTLGAVPLVQVTVNGTATYANPNDPHAVFGDPGTTYDPEPAATAQPFDNVSVTLALATSADPAKPFAVAQGDFPLSDLVGRQLVAQFVPAVALDVALGTPIGELREFFPVIGLRGPDLTSEESADRTVAGALINTSGDCWQVDDGGQVVVNGQPLLTTAADPAAVAATIASVEMTVQGAGFTDIRVRVRALDKDAKPVPGLPASSLQLEEEGKVVPFVLLSNAPAPRRLLFLLDTSDSLPPEFRGAAVGTLVQTIAEQLKASQPDMQFSSAAVLGGMTTPTPFTSDPVTAGDDAAAASGYASALWAALAAAADFEPDVIVFITDGQVDDPPTADELSRIANGPPVVLIGTGTTDPDSLGHMAAASGGAVFAVTDPAQAVAAIVAFEAAHQDFAYELRYAAPEQGPSLRNVSFSIPGTAMATSGTYEVPAQADRIQTPVVTGIFLTVQVGDEDAVTRLLAGVSSLPEGETPSAALIEEIQFALLGSAILSFEADAPTLAHWIDDLATSKLSVRTLWEAYQKADSAAAMEAFAGGLIHVPGQLAVLHSRLAQPNPDEPVTVPLVRVAMLTNRLVPNQGLVQRVDVLPFTRFYTTTDDPAVAFQRTLERSALLAIAEQVQYDTTTASLLQGKELRVVPSLTVISDVLADLPADLRAAWVTLLEPYWTNINVLPKDGTPLAFWTIDERTGSCLGILPDGSGGGLTTQDQAMAKAATTLLNAAALAGEYGGFGLAFGGFIALQKAILKVILWEAAVVASIGDSSTPPFDPNKAACDLVCDLAKGAVFDHYGLGAVAKVDAWKELLTGDGIPCGC